MTDQTVLINEDESVEDADHVQSMLDKAAKLDPDYDETAEQDVATEEEGGDAAAEDSDEQTEDDDATEDEGSDEESSSQEESESEVSFEDLTREFTETGTLSDETIEALENFGIPREVVEAHINGLNAQAELTRMEAVNAFGGEEQFSTLQQWAGNNLNEAEIDRINNLVAAGDFDGYLLAMEGVKARYEANFGSLGGQPLAGNTAQTYDIFESQAEMKEAMRDPRYQTDEAYRERIAAKLARTRRSQQV